jgi:hypothetical protein
MDLLVPLHPVADVLDLAGEAAAALGVVTMVAASRWLPAESLGPPTETTLPARDLGGGPRLAGIAKAGNRRHPRWTMSTR